MTGTPVSIVAAAFASAVEPFVPGTRAGNSPSKARSSSGVQFERAVPVSPGVDPTTDRRTAWAQSLTARSTFPLTCTAMRSGLLARSSSRAMAQILPQCTVPAAPASRSVRYRSSISSRIGSSDRSGQRSSDGQWRRTHSNPSRLSRSG